MLTRLISLAVIVAAAWWYWTGPYQQKHNPDYQAILDRNEEKMSACVRGHSYRAGATGQGLAGAAAERACAEEYNLYLLDGKWHSYDMPRPQ